MSRQRFVVEIDEGEQFSVAAIASFMRRSVDNPAAVRATEIPVMGPAVSGWCVEIPNPKVPDLWIPVFCCPDEKAAWRAARWLTKGLVIKTVRVHPTEIGGLS